MYFLVNVFLFKFRYVWQLILNLSENMALVNKNRRIGKLKHVALSLAGQVRFPDGISILLNDI